ncbi:phosphoribulokinase/uridine kinase family protein [Niveomyces insectorum RCEF 264]|uniref:Phosphoribulokinase/uridine kinase family protein n=1 Tax=Niveomyces insectorum RCEF 264 TaxID=1081102 RepID=A0A162MTZ6_9HYPO|nr:phosphoribulokinase/uridine kinase family protein [Niveomyces insectorum RCEF 264]
MLVAPSDADQAVPFLCQRIQKLLRRTRATRPDKRVLVALAGVPGSGKTTVATAVLAALVTEYGIKQVQVVPMDGFHYSNAVLATFADPAWAVHRRGAPFTFDADAFVKLIARLQSMPVTAADEPEIIIRAPSFDHARKDPVPNDIAISSRTELVIIEGNYTLLDQPPWNKIAQLVDDKYNPLSHPATASVFSPPPPLIPPANVFRRWFVDSPAKVVRQRLIDRHLRAGIETTEEAAARRAEENDIPNGLLILSHLVEPDVRICN